MESKVIEQIKLLESAILVMKNAITPSLNSGKPSLEWRQKVVFLNGEFIYRVESINTAMQRILFSRMCNASGENLMLEEEILFRGSFCIFTKQRKVEINKNRCLNEDALREVYPKTMELFDRYKCIFYNGDNFGMDGDMPKIFDYAANVAFRNEGGVDKLFNDEGECIWEK